MSSKSLKSSLFETEVEKKRRWLGMFNSKKNPGINQHEKLKFKDIPECRPMLGTPVQSQTMPLL